jgi:diaminohydroxyphosphoribosylaminopyrimidine deaminase/5-amino-6-(5-phosphoribosylamino)uracil reductase
VTGKKTRAPIAVAPKKKASKKKVVHTSPPGEREERYMRMALELAARAVGRTTPNPAVGTVIVRGDEVLATGYHQYAGSDHAEVAALRKLGFNALDTELYTTLEPCDHQGRTGPCTEAILRAGVSRVVVGALDPNPLVSGKGIRKLVIGGLDVVQGVLAEECAALNEAYNFAIVNKRPFVVLKAAVSLDGRIATSTGESKWISSEESRKKGHELRDRLDAILVGIETVLLDDPALTTRLPGARNPLRVVLDSKLRIPTDSVIAGTAKETRTLIATTGRASARKRRALEKLGAEVLEVPENANGRASITSVLEALHEREMNSVLVEGGATVHGAFIDARLVNKLVLFMAPVVIGGRDAPLAIGGEGVSKLADAMQLENMRVEQVGPDLMITAYPAAEKERE